MINLGGQTVGDFSQEALIEDNNMHHQPHHGTSRQWPTNKVSPLSKEHTVHFPPTAKIPGLTNVPSMKSNYSNRFSNGLRSPLNHVFNTVAHGKPGGHNRSKSELYNTILGYFDKEQTFPNTFAQDRPFDRALHQHMTYD